jgi:hypothetical protein
MSPQKVPLPNICIIFAEMGMRINVINNITDVMARLLNFLFDAILIEFFVNRPTFHILPLYHPCENPFCCKKFFGTTAFGDRAAVEDYDFVGIGNRAHPVGND